LKWHGTCNKHILCFSEGCVSLYHDSGYQYEKILYFSYEAASQCKKRKKNLVIYQKKDFLIAAEWHFFVTNRDKCLCDAVDGMTDGRQPKNIFKILTKKNK
jgi:hypothetical protein